MCDIDTYTNKEIQYQYHQVVEFERENFYKIHPSIRMYEYMLHGKKKKKIRKKKEEKAIINEM